MSDLATVDGVSAALRELWPNGSVGERIRDAALALRWSHNRTRDLWYAQARQILAVETDRLRAHRANRAGQTIKELTHERTELAARLDRMEAMLSALLAASSRGDASAAGSLSGAQGRAVGAGDPAGNA